MNILYIDDSQRLIFATQDSQDNTSYKAVSSSNLKTDTWYHIAGIYDPKNGYKVYLNGAMEGSNNTTSWYNTNPNQSIGARYRPGGNSDQFFTGKIQDLRIYNRPLSKSEIQTLVKMGGLDIK